jgi:hypothetical protein
MGQRAAKPRPVNVPIASARITTASGATFYFNSTPVDYNTAGGALLGRYGRVSCLPLEPAPLLACLLALWWHLPDHIQAKAKKAVVPTPAFHPPAGHTSQCLVQLYGPT